MPFGLTRCQHSGQSHFLTFSCYHRQPYFDRADLCDLFLTCLEATRRRYGFRVFGYVVMPEHVHLLVSEPDIELLSTAIQALKISFVRRATLKPTSAKTGQMWGTVGNGHPFWLKRYYDHNVRTYESFVRKLRYIHRNPVKRGLCKEPMDWPWSSFRHYATAEIGVVEIESEWTAMRRTGRVPHLPKPGRCGAPSW